MITSADNEPWEGDVAIIDHAGAGLPAPSIVRTAKIGTVEARQSEFAGHVSDEVMSKVDRILRASLTR